MYFNIFLFFFFFLLMILDLLKTVLQLTTTVPDVAMDGECGQPGSPLQHHAEFTSGRTHPMLQAAEVSGEGGTTHSRATEHSKPT